jgi:oligoribonuclease
MMLYWLDLETTGLSSVDDVILEVAIASADMKSPFLIDEVESWVLPLDGRDLSAFIANMHTKNGLLAECAKSATTLAAVEEHLLSIVPDIDSYEDKPTLAGSSIHFDHAFLKAHMPRLAARFSHRYYDVSAVKLFCRSLGMERFPKAEAHRAADDIRESVDHAYRCYEWLQDHFAGGASTDRTSTVRRR